MRRVLISTKPFIFVLFLVGITVRSAESLSSAIERLRSADRTSIWALQLREQILKEQITDERANHFPL